MSDRGTDVPATDISLQSHLVASPENRGNSAVRESSVADDATPLVAEVLLEHDSLFLTPTLQSRPDATIFVDPPTGTPLESQTPFFSVVVDDADSIDASLDADGTVASVVDFGTFGDGRVLRGRPTERTIPVVPAMVELGVRVVEMHSQREGWRLRLQLRSHPTVREVHDLCETYDVSFSLLKLLSPDDTTAQGTSLTKGQRNALLTALEMGYFDLPRRASQEDVAAALGVSASAVSQRLRRATAELIADTFATEF